MKKLLAIVMTLVLIMGLSVPVFAAKSPVADEVYTVLLVRDADDKVGYSQTIKKGDTVKFACDPDKGTFDGWNIYKADATPATVGVDYEVVSTSSLKEKTVLGASNVLGTFALTAEVIEIKPLANLIVTANYNGILTNPIISTGEDVAPETGDSTVLALSALAVVALCGAVVSKKQLAK